MSEIVFVEPGAFYAPGKELDNGAGLAAVGEKLGDLPAASQTHMALYEWIRKFMESKWIGLHDTSLSLRDVEEADAVLRELIALDESQVRMNCITRRHVTRLMRDWQQRERNLAMTEALSKYQLQRLLYWERRDGAGNDVMQRPANSSQQMEELQQCLAVVYAPELSRAAEMQKLAEEKLYATTQVLEHRTVELNAMRDELDGICQALNELAVHVNVEARCEDRRSACAAIHGGGGRGGGLCTPQQVVKAVQGRVSELQAQWATDDCSGCYGGVAAVSGDAKCGFDVLTAALHRLEDARAECYALQSQVGGSGQQRQQHLEAAGRKEARVASVAAEAKPGDFSSRVSTAAAAAAPCLLDVDSSRNLLRLPPVPGVSLIDGFSMESRGYEVHQAALQEQRRFLLMIKSLCGLRAILLRPSAEHGPGSYPGRPLSLFAGHSVSLHQWVMGADGDAKPGRYAAVFYPMVPQRQGEMPQRQLEAPLVTQAGEKKSLMSVIDLRHSAEAVEAAALGAHLSGGAVRFSVDGRFMYVCCGAADASQAARRLILRVVQTLCGKLAVPPLNCFCYYRHNCHCCSSCSSSSSSAAAATSLGWVGTGVCAWALDGMAFASPAERLRFMSHLRENYHTVIHLGCSEVHNFAADCAEIASRSPTPDAVRRRLVISSRALRSLSADNYATLTSWYGIGGCIVPDLSTIEHVGGHSAGSMMIVVVTHGSNVPPPPKSGFLSFSGIGATE